MPETRYSYAVTVGGCSEEQADQVIAERLGHDEDYGFPYDIRKSKLDSPTATTYAAASAALYQAGVQIVADFTHDSNNYEYLRGQLELLADLFPKEGVEISERKDQIEADVVMLYPPDPEIVVGLNATASGEPKALRRFPATPDGYNAAVDFIDGLEGHEDGRYYLDAPEGLPVNA